MNKGLLGMQLSDAVQNAESNRHQRQLRDQQVRMATAKAKQAEQMLAEHERGKNKRDLELANEVQALKNQLAEQQRTGLYNSTIDYFTKFDSTGDVKYLNLWQESIMKNPLGVKLHGDAARYDKLTQTAEHDELVKVAGFDPATFYDSDLPEDFVVVTRQDGKKHLVERDLMYNFTKFNRHMEKESLKRMEDRARVRKAIQAGEPQNKATLKERVAQSLIESGQAPDLASAYQIVQRMDKGDTSANLSKEERMVRAIQEDSENEGKKLSFLEAYDIYNQRNKPTKSRSAGKLSSEERFIANYRKENPEASYTEASVEYANRSKTAAQKEIESIEELTTGLDEVNWLDTDLSTLSKTERNKFYRSHIAPLERLTKFNLTSGEKKAFRQIQELTQLADTVGYEVSDKETGLIDNMFATFKRYVSDEVGGTAGISAYESFRNIFRNTLFGASVTGNEKTAFNKQLGGLGQKTGPVLAQFKEQLMTLKSRLTAIKDLNNPHIVHWYLGMPEENIENIIEAIDERIEVYTSGATSPVDEFLRPQVPVSGGNGDFNFDALLQEAGLTPTGE